MFVKMARFCLLTLFIFSLYFPQRVVASSPEKSAEYILQNILLWDGMSDNFRPSSLWVKNDRIEKIFASNVDDGQSHLPRIDGLGKFVIPGMINAHVHVLNTAGCKPGFGFKPWTPLENLKDFQRTGFTVVADQASWPQVIAAFSQVTRNNPQAGSKIVFAGPIFTAKGGYPDYWMPDSARRVGVIKYIEKDNQATLKKLKELGVSQIKVGLQEVSLSGHKIQIVDDDKLSDLIKQAHDLNLPVFAHALTLFGYEQGLKNHVDGFIHGSHEDLTDSVINELVNKQIGVVPTIWVWKSVWATPENRELMNNFSDGISDSIRNQWEAYIKDYARADTLPEYLVHDAGISKSLAKSGNESLLKNIKKLKERGVRLIFGTDAPYCFDTASGAYQEMLELKEVPLSNREIVKMATNDAARFLRLDRDYGTLEAGKKADFVLLSGNPFDDLSVFKKPFAVYQDGQNITSLNNEISLADKIKSAGLFLKASFSELFH